jgi:hypothetical protein
MNSENIAPRGGCRFISGEPSDAVELGETSFCNVPVAHPGSSWCREHEAIVFLPPEVLTPNRRAA